VRQLVEAHIRKQGFEIVAAAPDADMRRAHPRVVRLEWSSGYAAQRTSMDLPISRRVVQVVEEAVGDRISAVPSLGGSLPMSVFGQELGVPVIGVPIVNHDNNQHAADENLRLQNLWDGIEIFAALMHRLGSGWP
jgi:acetylornithine deacetylase/succinyl-diaminopimelate desuccinylase-like protein